MTLFRDLLIDKKRRKYYTEVEYLESTGTQYIDTKYVMTSGHSSTFNGNIMWTQNAATANFFYGYRSVNSATYEGDMRAFFIYGASPAGRLAIRYGVNTDNSTSVAVSLNTKCNISWDGDNLKVNGTTYATLTQAYTPANYKNMWLFWCNCTGYYSTDVGHFVGRIYNWQIFDNGILVRDFIPVLDWNMKPCLFDKVTEQLFYNQATSGNDFSYGREIHYVDYIESTGTQYIDTGIKPNNNTSAEIDYQLTQATQTRAGLFGALNMSGSNQGRFGSILSPSNSYMEHGYGSGNDYWQQGLPDTNRHLLYQKKNEVYFDGTLIHTFNTATFSLAMNAYLGNFVYTNYTPAKAKYYSSRWWDGDKLIREYSPAIDENGVGFWFDKVSHTIYDNAGQGSFKYPAREVEYLESTGTQYIDTGYIPNINTECSMNLAFVSLDSTYRTPFSVRTSDGATNSFTIMSVNSQQSNNSFAFGSSYWSGSSVPSVVLNKTVEAVLRKGYASWDGVSGSPGTSITPTSLTAYMFARNANGTAGNFFIGKIYSCLIKDNNTTVRDYIPVFKDGASGMLDKANNVFYSNAGTGSFSVGKIFEPKYE